MMRALRLGRLSANARWGVFLIAAVLLVAVLVVAKPRLLVMARPGETARATFPRSMDVEVGATDVKIAGAKVGKVSGVSVHEDGTMTVSMKVDDGTRALLRGAPSAAVRPVTLLGGRYYIDLVPGGTGALGDAPIPVARTSVPVELPEVLSALQPDARAGLRSTIADLDAALGAGGARELRALAASAPDSLRPAGRVFSALRGKTPTRDLAELVSAVNLIAADATRKDGQIEGILDDLSTVAGTLDSQRAPLGRLVADLPSTLQKTRTGMEDLQQTLRELTRTSAQIRPIARSLDDTLRTAGPVLRRTRPVLADARGLLADLDPVVEALVPAARDAEAVVEDVRGPVLNRVNGPLMTALRSEWKGSGPYDGNGGTGRVLYQEVGVLAARFNNLSKHYDQNGPYANLQLGVGTNSLGGTPIDRLLLALTKIWGSPK